MRHEQCTKLRLFIRKLRLLLLLLPGRGRLLLMLLLGRDALLRGALVRVRRLLVLLVLLL